MAPFPCIATNTSPPLGGGAKKKGSSAQDEETAYDSYTNPEPGFRAGPGDSYDAAKMAPFPCIATKGGAKKNRYRTTTVQYC